MKTIQDNVMEQARGLSKTAGTSDGLKLLELSNDPAHYTAANLYLASLEIIKKLSEQKPAVKITIDFPGNIE